MKHLRSWTCERCSPEIACEVITEEDRAPTCCPYNLLAGWKLFDTREVKE